MLAYVEMASHYRSLNFVVMSLVGDEFKGVTEVVEVAMEVEIVWPRSCCWCVFLACSY